MNEFDNNEERLEPHITEENEKEAVNNTSDSTEGNTTYHYAYKKPIIIHHRAAIISLRKAPNIVLPLMVNQ